MFNDAQFISKIIITKCILIFVMLVNYAHRVVRRRQTRSPRRALAYIITIIIMTCYTSNRHFIVMKNIIIVIVIMYIRLHTSLFISSFIDHSFVCFAFYGFLKLALMITNAVQCIDYATFVSKHLACIFFLKNR